jgi:sec-independent protein translocase protein TatA
VHFSSPADIFGVDGIIIVIVLALVLFGSTQIPKLARSLGSAQKEFQKGLDNGAPGENEENSLLLDSAPVLAAGPVPVVVPAGSTQGSGHLDVDK